MLNHYGGAPASSRQIVRPGHAGGPDHAGARLKRPVDPLALLAGLDGDIVRMAYEPPTLSELFRAAVAGETASVPEVSGVAG